VPEGSFKSGNILRDYLRLFIVAASECMLESLFTVAAT
jgi:hypothetical protein